MQSLEVRSFRWLGQLLVRRSSHEPAEFDEDCLHGEFTLPVGYAWKLAEINLEYDISAQYPKSLD